MNGATYDGRVKVSVVGQDRVGKTSLCKALRGLLFDKNERSTNGVVLSNPVANAGTTPWNSLQPDFVDHKITEEVASELRGTLDKQPTQQNETEESRRKKSLVATENGRFYKYEILLLLLLLLLLSMCVCVLQCYGVVM